MGFRKVGFYAYYYFKALLGNVKVPGFNADGSYCRMCGDISQSIDSTFQYTASASLNF